MKIRTDFVTNSSSSSFVAVTVTTKDGEVIKGQSKMGSGYHEIPLISGTDEDEILIKEVIDNSKNGIEFCDSLYQKLLFDIHSIHDDLYEIRDIEDFDKVAKIHIEAIQEGSNGGAINYAYNLEKGETQIEYPKTEWDYYDDFQEEKLSQYFDGVKGFDRDDDFEITNGILVKYSGNLKRVIVPDGVIGIGTNAFYYKLDIKEVVLPNSIKFIDCNAFSYCSRLEKINLPEGLQCIGSKAFLSCNSIKKLEIPDTVIELGYKCFSYMENLKEIKLPAYITVIKSGLLLECRKLEKVELPNSLTEIRTDAFSGCHTLKEIKIPEGVTKLGDCVFWDCINLEQLYLPSTVKELFAGQLCYTHNLKLIEVDENNKDLKAVDGALYTGDMRKLIKCFTDKKEFTVNENTVYIGEYAFENNKSIEKVNLPNTIKRIGLEAFYGCESLKEIDLPEGILSIEEDAFRLCTGLNKISLPKSLDIDLYDYFNIYNENLIVIRK